MPQLSIQKKQEEAPWTQYTVSPLDIITVDCLEVHRDPKRATTQPIITEAKFSSVLVISIALFDLLFPGETQKWSGMNNYTLLIYLLIYVLNIW